jgi:hypothetical protein
MPSSGGARYFVSFMNDFSYKSFRYILKSNGECFSKFKDFVAFEKNQTRKKNQDFE